MNQELILDYCFYLKKRLFISDGSFIMPAPTEILHLKCCICKNRIFLSDRRRNVCINYTPRKERFLEYTGIIMSVRPSVRPSFCLWKFVNGPYILCRNTGSFYFTKTMLWFEGHVCHDLDKNQLFVTFLITYWDFGLTIDNICKTAFAMA